MRTIRVVLLLCVVILGASLAAAQDGDDDFQDIFDEVPTFRGEDGAFTLGDPDAPVTIVEFADFLCPHCQDYYFELKPFIEDYVLTGQAKYEYRFFPIIDETLSPLLSAINECAFEQGAFWTAHDVIYTLARDRAIDADIVGTVAEQVGIDGELLETCVNASATFQFVTDQTFGQDLGVTGTPAIRVRVGDGETGALRIDGTDFTRGGAPISALVSFVESEDPAELVVPVNQLRDETLLADTSVVDGEPCLAPCWRGITPGETTFDEAIDLVNAMDDARDIQVQEQGGSQSAQWLSPDGTSCCQMISQTGEAVDVLQVRIQPDVTLGQIIETYGDPTYIEGGRYTSTQTLFTIYYTDLPLVLFVFASGNDVALTESSEVIGLVFVSEDVMGSVVDSAMLHAWEGYESLDTYDAGEFELNPGS